MSSVASTSLKKASTRVEICTANSDSNSNSVCKDHSKDHILPKSIISVCF